MHPLLPHLLHSFVLLVFSVPAAGVLRSHLLHSFNAADLSGANRRCESFTSLTFLLRFGMFQCCLRVYLGGIARRFVRAPIRFGTIRYLGGIVERSVHTQTRFYVSCCAP